MQDPPNERTLGIDFRLSNGDLYGVSDANRFYRIDLATGNTTVIGTMSEPLGGAIGVAVEPVVDHLRVSSGARDRSFYFDFATGSTNVASFEDESLQVVGAEYSNELPCFGGVDPLDLYYIDADSNALHVHRALRDDFVQRDSLGVDFADTSIDISSDGTAYYLRH